MTGSGLAAAGGLRPLLDRRRTATVGRRADAAVGVVGAVVVAAVVVGLGALLFADAAPALGRFGPRFLWASALTGGIEGAGPLLVGTLVTTTLALLVAVPVGVGSAVFLSELAPRRVAGPLGAVIELLAAVPSIVVGLWGLLVLSPVFARDVEPFLHRVPGLGHLAGGVAYGPSVLLAGVVLAVMVLPTVVALSRAAMAAVDDRDRDAARALGATPWQVVRTAVLPGARRGIEAAVVLAVGRAVGESIAVAMVIGNRPAVPHSLIAPGATLASWIVNQFAEASGTLPVSAVMALAALLLVVTAAVGTAGQLLRRRTAPAP